MSKIFICHSSRDAAAADEMVDRLKQEGYRSLFLSEHPQEGIPAGKRWEEELYRKLRRCKALLVLCSEHSMNSRWCFAEITQAKGLGKRIFPVQIGPCQIYPELSSGQIIDLTLDKEEGYQRLWRGFREAGIWKRTQDVIAVWSLTSLLILALGFVTFKVIRTLVWTNQVQEQLLSWGGSATNDPSGLGYVVNLPGSVTPSDALPYIRKLGKVQKLKGLNIIPRRSKLAQLKDLDVLMDFFPAVSLNLYLMETRDVLDLKRLNKLQSVNLTGTGVSQLEGLEQLSALECLLVPNTPLTDLPGLETCLTLTNLDVSHTYVKRLAGLENLKALRVLAAKETSLTTLTNLRNARRLLSLNVSQTLSLKQLPPLECWPALEFLDVSRTGLASLPGLKHLTHLTNLDVSDTAITDLSGLSNHTRLMRLNVKGTSVPAVELDALRQQWPDLDLQRD